MESWENHNANEEVPGTAAEGNVKIILRCLGRNKRIICVDIKEVARGRREEKAIRVVGSAVNLRL
jgi:DNA-binding protein YbaB